MGETKEYRVTIPTDEEGMHGKECPNPGCGKYFKIKPATGIAENPVVFCPYCKHQGTPQDFITKDQIEYAKSIAVRDILGQFTKELKKLETRSPSRNSLFSIEIKVESRPYPIRHYMEKKLQENVTCAECTCEYAIFGMFAVCPDCGKHNLFQMFMKNLDVVRKQVQLEDELHKKFDETDKSHVDALMKDMGNKLVENACEDAVSTFETFCKQAYEQGKNRSVVPSLVLQGNPFQSLDRAKDTFSSKFGLDILAGLTPDEIDGVYLLFNKRHILTHNLGIIDQKFLKSTGLRQDILSHKVEVTKQEVLSALSTIQKLGESIKDGLLK